MSYNAIIRLKQKRASGLFGEDRGWDVGSSQASAIGIPSRLVKTISERTNTIKYIDGERKDDRNLVIIQNTLSGIGRYRSQFNVDADGIEHMRFYLDDTPLPPFNGFVFSMNDLNWSNIVSLLGSEEAAIPVIPNSMTYQTYPNYGKTGNTYVMVQYTDDSGGSDVKTTGFTMTKVLNDLSNVHSPYQYNINILDWNNIPFAEQSDKTGYQFISKTPGTFMSWMGSMALANPYRPPKFLNNTPLSYAFGITTIENDLSNSSFETIGSWNTSNVVDMTAMFSKCIYFNQNIEWNVGQVTDMTEMFFWCVRFEGQGLMSWDVNNVKNMYKMLSNCPKFNETLNWNVSQVTDMGFMFYGCSKFLGGGLNNWVVDNVTNMGDMFVFCDVFNQDISGWNVSKVENTRSMFNQASIFNQDISGWNISSVTDTGYMFNKCYKFNQGFNWNTTHVTDMQYMFNECSDFIGTGLNSWNVDNVINMQYMFNGCSNFIGTGLSSWNVTKVTNMSHMFYNCSNFNQDISGWDLSIMGSNGDKILDMFTGTGLNSVNNNNIYNKWIGAPNNFSVGSLNGAGLSTP